MLAKDGICMGKTGNRFSGSQKMSAVLSICPAICERIFGGTLFIFYK